VLQAKAGLPTAARMPKVGAGGETRTHTTFYGPRILSPVRLPFRHTGCFLKTLVVNSGK